MPVGKLIPIPDFLPPPSEIVLPEQNIKVTILLNKASVEFFKKEAAKNHTKYQRMIRAVLDKYAQRHHTE